MKTNVKVIFGLVFSFVFCFLCIGYATLTDELRVVGEVSASSPEALYITNVELVSSNVSSQSAYEIFPTNLDCTLRGSNYRSVTYAVTVFNNTRYKYAYEGIEFETDDYYSGNQYINKSKGLTITTKDRANDSGNTFNELDSIAAGEVRTFYVTYSIGSNVSNREIKTLINFDFGLHVDSMGDYAIDACLRRFMEILNDTSSGGGYETLTERIDDKYDGYNNWKANYIGNVVDSSSADTETVETLFGDDLSITIGGVQTNVTLLIKRENLDNNANTGDDYSVTHANGGTTSATGCEMTLYMTTDKLQGGSPTVYAAVFTCDKNGDGTYGTWYLLGEVYAGTATIVGYEGGQYTGSFDTGTWRSYAATYNVSDDYSYSVANNSTIQTITRATDANARAVLQSRIDIANRVINGGYGDYAGQAVVNLAAVLEKASRCYTVDAAGNIIVNSGATRSQVIPLIKEMDNALSPFDSIING